MSKFYVTTAIAYVNAPPHIGFALELLQGDVLARFHRQQDNDVHFLTGADEHGTKIARTARQQGKEVRELVDEITPQFEQLANSLNCSNDDFIRTSDQERHWPGVQKLWQALNAADALYKDTYEGYYCVGCEAYITETELVDGNCPIHDTPPEHVEEENYFFRLSAYEDAVRQVIEDGTLRIVPESRRNELLSFIENEGLRDVSFSRPAEKLPWGVPVPGDKEHTIYVWADALPNYITAIGYGSEAKDQESKVQGFNFWWPADVHVIGKDILRFHAAIWPAMLIAADLELPNTILVHGFITTEGEKMSKSKGNVIDPFDLIDRYGVDPVRYYLLREIPTTDDGDYSEQRFEERYNGDLANGVGNLVSRLVTLAARNNVGIVAADLDKGLAQALKQARDDRNTAIEAFRFHEALAAIWKLITRTDQFIEETKPWELAKNKGQRDDLERVLGQGLRLLNEVATLLKPFLPETATRIRDAVTNQKLEQPLFPRID